MGKLKDGTDISKLPKGFNVVEAKDCTAPKYSHVLTKAAQYYMYRLKKAKEGLCN